MNSDTSIAVLFYTILNLKNTNASSNWRQTDQKITQPQMFFYLQQFYTPYSSSTLQLQYSAYKIPENHTKLQGTIFRIHTVILFTKTCSECVQARSRITHSF